MGFYPLNPAGRRRVHTQDSAGVPDSKPPKDAGTLNYIHSHTHTHTHIVTHMWEREGSGTRQADRHKDFQAHHTNIDKRDTWYQAVKLAHFRKHLLALM